MLKKMMKTSLSDLLNVKSILRIKKTDIHTFSCLYYSCKKKNIIIFPRLDCILFVRKPPIYKLLVVPCKLLEPSVPHPN
jgi:hypothetical protein